MLKKPVTITVPAHDFFAAAHMRGKTDIRRFIDGVCLKNGLIFGTSGHAAYYCKSKAIKLPKEIQNIVVKVKGNFSVKKSDDLLANIKIFPTGNDEAEGIVTIVRAHDVVKSPIKIMPFTAIINIRLPDFEKIIPQGDLKPVEKVSVNLSLLCQAEKVQKIFNRYGSVINFRGGDKGILITFNMIKDDDSERAVIVMPMRD